MKVGPFLIGLGVSAIGCGLMNMGVHLESWWLSGAGMAFIVVFFCLLCITASRLGGDHRMVTPYDLRAARRNRKAGESTDSV